MAKTYGGTKSNGVIGGKGKKSNGMKSGLVPTKEVCLKVNQTKRPKMYNPC